MNAVAAEAEVVVIGAGILGAAAAFELAQGGRDVLLLDRAEPGLEASSANAGTLAVQNKPVAAVPAALRAVALWEELSRRLDFDVEYEKRGGVRVAHTDDDARKLEEGVALQRAQGAPVELLRGADLRRAAPYLHGDVQLGSFCPLDGMANPLLAHRGYLRACTRLGVRIEAQRPVSAIEVLGDEAFRVDTPPGAVRARFVIAAAGAWTANVVRMIGREVPISVEVLQASITDSHTPLFNHIVTHVRGNLTLKQQRSGRILVGGAWRGEGDPTTGRKDVVRDSLVGNYRCAVQTIPGIAQARLLRAWPGFEGRTPDRLLLAGSFGRPRGFYVLGCGGGGFTFSPFAGQLAADFIRHGGVEAAGRAFDPARFVAAPPRMAAKNG